jgi:cysteinyl-tRNA synthetase
VKFWVHNEFLVLDKGKMSKSSGSFLTLQSLVDAGYDPMDYRYFLLGGHYRSQLQFSWESLETAKNARRSLLERIRALVHKAQAAGSLTLPEYGGEDAPPAAGLSEKVKAYLAAFDRALEDDLSSPRALAELWGLIRDPDISPEQALAGAFDMDRVLGFKLAASARSLLDRDGQDPALEKEIERLIAERGAAKKAKDYVKADSIRADLKERGILLEDTPAGTTWRQAR